MAGAVPSLLLGKTIKYVYLLSKLPMSEVQKLIGNLSHANPRVGQECQYEECWPVAIRLIGDWHLPVSPMHPNRANFCLSHISSVTSSPTCSEKWQRNIWAISLPPAPFSPQDVTHFFRMTQILAPSLVSPSLVSKFLAVEKRLKIKLAMRNGHLSSALLQFVLNILH